MLDPSLGGEVSGCIFGDDFCSLMAANQESRADVRGNDMSAGDLLRTCLSPPIISSRGRVYPRRRFRTKTADSKLPSAGNTGTTT